MSDQPPVPPRTTSLARRTADDSGGQQLSKWPAVYLAPNCQGKVSVLRGAVRPEGLTPSPSSGANYPPVVEVRRHKPPKPRAIVVATDATALNSQQQASVDPTRKEDEAVHVGEPYYSPATSDAEEPLPSPDAKDAAPPLVEEVPAAVSDDIPTRGTAQRETRCAEVQTDVMQTEYVNSSAETRQDTRDFEVQTSIDSALAQLPSLSIGMQTHFDQHLLNNSDVRTEFFELPAAEVFHEFGQGGAPGVPSVSSVRSSSTEFSQQDLQASSRLPERLADSQRSESPQQLGSQNVGGRSLLSSPILINQGSNFGSQFSMSSAAGSSQQSGSRARHHYHYYYGPHVTHIHNYSNCTIHQAPSSQDTGRSPNGEGET